MKKSYQELLLDPRWQKRKAEIMQRDNFTCQKCGATTKTLHVHHKYYDGRNPWEYEDDALITLCDECHNEEHGKSIPKIGQFYEYWDGDYPLNLVLYHVDHRNGSAYMFGIDFGAYANGYIYVIPYDTLRDIKPIDIDEDDSYNLTSLYFAYAKLLRHDVDVFGSTPYRNSQVIDFAIDKVKPLLDANEVISSFFEQYNQKEGLL